MGVEKRRAAKRHREVAFALQSQATGTEKAGWSGMGTKTDRNQHTMGTLGVSEAGEAWDWRLTDSQSAGQVVCSVQNAAVTA
jgi:hypothetical protein